MVIKRLKVFFKTRIGKGFSIGELRWAGLSVDEVRKLGIYVDKKRRSKHQEKNVETLKNGLKLSNSPCHQSYDACKCF
ncbi:MAG: ribosomal protein L13e [Candidatus Bathyarchaeota archaeon]|nr:ribosomal protein L13e [Candidatus Bathyarchaeota archaeon]